MGGPHGLGPSPGQPRTGFAPSLAPQLGPRALRLHDDLFECRFFFELVAFANETDNKLMNDFHHHDAHYDRTSAVGLT